MDRNITTTQALVFFLDVKEELRRYTSSVIGRTRCPLELRAPANDVQGASSPPWTAVRAALARDPLFVDDVLSEVSIALITSESAQKFPTDKKGRRCWTWTIARRIAQRSVRKQMRVIGCPVEMNDDQNWQSKVLASPWQTGFESPERSVSRKLDAEELFDRLRRLSALELRLLTVAADGGDFTEFAAVIGRPASTVRSTWFRMRRRIQQWAEAERGEDAL